MKAISLFSGCGGLDLGAEMAGVEVVYANDFDKDACATLARLFPNTEVICGDITQIRTFPKADLLIGGYPCQSFSMGGKRDPEKDHRTNLYKEFARCLALVKPKYFIAENVSGLAALRDGKFLADQTALFESLGYHICHQVLDAKDYGVPQTRKRLFVVGVRHSLGRVFRFPLPTHGNPAKKEGRGLLPYTSHGEAIRNLPLWPEGEFYERPHDPEGHWSWYFMSRNRKARWSSPAFTVVANWRHVTLHPAGPVMTLTWSNLADGWKQRWDFSDQFEHLDEDPSRPRLEEPRRLSWRECAVIQTFPANIEVAGNVESKFTQIGNAVPPLLARAVVEHLVSGRGLVRATKRRAEQIGLFSEALEQL